MGPVYARPLQDVRKNHSEQTREERPGRFCKKKSTNWAPSEDFQTGASASSSCERESFSEVSYADRWRKKIC